MATIPVKYNPGILGDEELVRAFVVRHKCLELILETLRENASTAASNRHLLVVGPRGSGKTMLVRRVAAEVRSNPDYGKFWFPIVYGEESYKVSSAGEFWLEALAHLSEQRGAPELGRTLDELREERSDARLRERALTQLRDFADQQSKRLLLVVENLNMLCDQISPEAAWELRHTLAGELRIMLLGTATSRFDAIANAAEAWFELFALHELKPLNRKESRALWHSVANQDLKPGQAQAIRILTGGNPRLVTVLAGFAANRSFRELMEQLVHLIDDHTEYFKGHLDALPPKERKVFVGLLEQWNPVAAADLARAIRLGVSEVSALLSRLVSRGAVEVYEQRPRRKLYQVSERLYNIYYLMRRRGRPADRVRAAVSFMVMFYGGRRLAATIAELAREACGLPTGKSGDHFVAYAELCRRAPREVWVRALDQTPTEFFEREDAPEFIRRLPTAAKLASVLRMASDAIKARAWGEAEQAYRKAVELTPNLALGWSGLGFALAQTGRLRESEQAYRKSIELDQTSGVSWDGLGRVLHRLGQSDDAEQAFRTSIRLQPESACPWHYLGLLLSDLGRHQEAEPACLRATELDPKHVNAWNDFGIVLARNGRLKGAEQAFRKAIKLDSKCDPGWANLGRVLARQRRYDDAREAYRTATQVAPNEPGYWADFGHFTSEFRTAEEAEKVWAEALEKHPTLAPCAIHLLDARLQLGVPAKAILHQAEEWIERAGRTADVLNSMSRLVLRLKLTEALPQAERWARESISKGSPGRNVDTLALVCAARGNWPEALQVIRPVLDAAAEFKDAQRDSTEFAIQAAAAGHAREALEALQASKGAGALEPLLVGLRIYLGETPQVAKEILEIGRDVAERIHQVELADERPEREQKNSRLIRR